MKMKTEDYYDKKVYVYYIKDLPFKDVYAYTFSKKVSKKYEKQRNMNKIYKEKMYLDELEDIYENFLFSHRIHEIKEHPFYDGEDDIMILCTQMELEFLFLLLYLKYTTTSIPCKEPTQIRFFHSSIRICQKAIVRRFHV